MLSKNSTLKELNLAKNSIGANGLGYIAEGLSHDTGLENLIITTGLFPGGDCSHWPTPEGDAEQIETRH